MVVQWLEKNAQFQNEETICQQMQWFSDATVLDPFNNYVISLVDVLIQKRRNSKKNLKHPASQAREVAILLVRQSLLLSLRDAGRVGEHAK
jgi:hypothetical protein